MAHDPAATATAQGRPGDPHPVDEVLKPGPMVVYGLQHVMSMYAGAVAVGTSFAAVASMLAIGKAGPRSGPSRAE